MTHPLVKKIEGAYMKATVPDFRVGDTVDVLTRIVEGERERTQIFNGVVIARKGGGINEMFTVRRIVGNEGVERTFMLHSPRVVDIAVKRRGKTRRAKLFYLRDRVGKARKLRELRVSRTKASAKQAVASTAADEGAPEPEAMTV